MTCQVGRCILPSLGYTSKYPRKFSLQISWKLSQRDITKTTADVTRRHTIVMPNWYAYDIYQMLKNIDGKMTFQKK